jgi:hypothetical protein
MSNAPTAPRTPPFWDRQFAPELSWGQLVFDLVAGILLPVFCLVADPIVFRESPFGTPLLGGYAPLAYVAIVTGLLALAIWLLARRPAALLAGFLVAGALFALLLGIALFPFSLIGLFAGIGALGLSPFLTAFVFFRNSVRAWDRARQRTTGLTALVAAFGLLAAFGSPLLTQLYLDRVVTQNMELILSPNAEEATRGISRLRRYRFVMDLDRLVWAYHAEGDAVRRTRLAEAYKEITGVEIEHRLAVLKD